MLGAPLERPHPAVIPGARWGRVTWHQGLWVSADDKGTWKPQILTWAHTRPLRPAASKAGEGCRSRPHPLPGSYLLSLSSRWANSTFLEMALAKAVMVL